MPEHIPQHTPQQTKLIAKVADKKHPLEPWRDQICTCQHCTKSFSNLASMYSHLSHCRHRFLNRYYKIGNQKGNSYLFTLQLNPLRRRRNALQKLISDYHDPKILVGAVAYLINEGIIRNYSALPLEESEKMIQHPDGRVLYSVLKKLLTEKEFHALEAQVSVLNDEKDKLRQEAGIKI